jgi:hypothetical protein
MSRTALLDILANLLTADIKAESAPCSAAMHEAVARKLLAQHCGEELELLCEEQRAELANAVKIAGAGCETVQAITDCQWLQPCSACLDSIPQITDESCPTE